MFLIPLPLILAIMIDDDKEKNLSFVSIDKGAVNSAKKRQIPS